jgi:hypothetical protein
MSCDVNKPTYWSCCIVAMTDNSRVYKAVGTLCEVSVGCFRGGLTKRLIIVATHAAYSVDGVR